MSVELINILKYDVGKGDNTRRKDNFRSRSSSKVLLLRSRKRRQLDSLTTSAPDDVISIENQNNDKDRLEPSQASRVSAGEIEWSGATGGPPAEVVLRLHPAPSTTARTNFTSLNTSGSGVVVRAEEALIVAFVLLLWVAAIALFFNRWGKIRFVYKLMLEPYQPKFQQQHRQSCGLVDNSVSIAPHHRASLSRGCVSYDYGASFPAYQPCAYLAHRTRQNSVFVGNMGGMALIPESPPRRSRSAADIPALITPGDISSHPTPRSSRAASLHSAVDFRVYVPSPRASRASSLHNSVDMTTGSVQVHVRGSVTNIDRPRSPRRLTVTNV